MENDTASFSNIIFLESDTVSDNQVSEQTDETESDSESQPVEPSDLFPPIPSVSDTASSSDTIWSDSYNDFPGKGTKHGRIKRSALGEWPHDYDDYEPPEYFVPEPIFPMDPEPYSVGEGLNYTVPIRGPIKV